MVLEKGVIAGIKIKIGVFERFFATCLQILPHVKLQRSQNGIFFKTIPTYCDFLRIIFELIKIDSFSPLDL